MGTWEQSLLLFAVRKRQTLICLPVKAEPREQHISKVDLLSSALPSPGRAASSPLSQAV